MLHSCNSGRAAAILLSLLIPTLGGCMSILSGYNKAADAHGSSFMVAKDSSAAAWSRLRDYMKRSTTTAPIVISTDSLIQTSPAVAKGSSQYTARRETIGDSVRIWVDYDYVQDGAYDIFGRSLAVEEANSMAFHSHLGWDSFNMPDSLVPGYVAGTPIEPEKLAPKDGSIWIGGSYGKRNWGGWSSASAINSSGHRSPSRT